MSEITHQSAGTSRGTAHQDDNLKTAYEQLCKSHDAIDDFRSKLLALLPIASGGGIFLLLNKDSAGNNGLLEQFSTPIGIFGFLVTVGLFADEVYGIRKCHAIILAAQQLEAELGATGPFTTRPRELLGFINEPFAAGIIYPVVMAAWAFVGSHFAVPRAAPWIAGIVFLTGFVSMLFYNLCSKRDAEIRQLKKLSERMLTAEEAGDPAALKPLLDARFQILRGDGHTYTRKQYLDDVPTKKNRGRSADQVEVRVGWRKAVLTFRVTTTRDGDGKPAVGHFKNTQKFVQRSGEWQCTDWKVVKMEDD